MSGAIIVTFLLFFLPFVVWPLHPSFFETPKIYIAEISIIILCIIGIIQGNYKKILQYKIPFLILSILFLLSLSHLLTHPSSLAFFGNQFRQQGTMLLWLLLLFSYFSSQVRLNKIPLWVFVVLIEIEFLAGIFVRMTVDGRAVGTLGEPNALAGFVVFLWPFIVWQTFTDKQAKIFIPLTTLCILLIILMTGSRSGLVAFGIEAVFFTLVGLIRISLAKATIICVLLFFSSLFLPFFQKQQVYENRGEIWSTAVIAEYQYPLTGWGFGNIEIALGQYNKKLLNRLQGYYVDSSHNIFLDFWVQGGFIGMALLVCLVYMSIRLFVEQKKVCETGLMLGLLVSLSFNPASIVMLLAFWWLIGQAVFSFD